jgi:acyl-CoA reductase-like NAD-dependent aldehyde dehydrogenase
MLNFVGERIAVMRSSDENDVNLAVSSAKKAFSSCSLLSGTERGRLLHKASLLLRVWYTNFILASHVFR